VTTTIKRCPDGYTPKHKRAVLAQQVVRKTILLIRKATPTWWFIENPRGMCAEETPAIMRALF
jgi:hypothetical protein